MAKNECNHTETRREDWGTPGFFIDWLRDVGFDFKCDLAASEHNATCKAYIGEESDFLSMTFDEHVRFALLSCYDYVNDWHWCNPPYEKKGLGRWIKELADVPNIVTLIPASPGSVWFRDVWSRFDYVVFMDGRLSFNGANQGAQFDSVLAIRGDRITKGMINELSEFGTVIDCSALKQSTCKLRDILKEMRKKERQAKKEMEKNEGTNSDDPGCVCSDPVSCHCGGADSGSEAGDGDGCRCREGGAGDEQAVETDHTVADADPAVDGTDRA